MNQERQSQLNAQESPMLTSDKGSSANEHDVVLKSEIEALENDKAKLIEELNSIKSQFTAVSQSDSTKVEAKAFDSQNTSNFNSIKLLEVNLMKIRKI